MIDHQQRSRQGRGNGVTGSQGWGLRGILLGGLGGGVEEDGERRETGKTGGGGDEGGEGEWGGVSE